MMQGREHDLKTVRLYRVEEQLWRFASEMEDAAPASVPISEAGLTTSEAGSSEDLSTIKADTQGLGKACVVCFDHVGDHVFLPCGHGGYCSTCCLALCKQHSRLCPVCRACINIIVYVADDTPIGSYRTLAGSRRPAILQQACGRDDDASGNC
jgi:hypothetical protein